MVPVFGRTAMNHTRLKSYSESPDRSVVWKPDGHEVDLCCYALLFPVKTPSSKRILKTNLAQLLS